MKHDFKISQHFARQYRKIKKKHRSLPEDLKKLKSQLDDNPKTLGPHLQQNCYKVRMAIRGSGKSGGARVIYYLVEDKEITFLAIYLKSEKDTATEKEIEGWLNDYKNQSKETTKPTE